MKPLSIRRQIEAALPTAAELLRQRKATAAFRILAQAEIETEQTDYDNWNGGTEIWTAYLRVPVSVFVETEGTHDQLCGEIAKAIDTAIVPKTGFDIGVEIAVQQMPRRGSRVPDGRISKQTRSAVLDELRVRKTEWHGALDDCDFLERLYDLQELPSYDSRYQNALQDIYQHRFLNDDWNVDWIYTDHRFDLLNGDQEQFLRFACETIHPVIRTDRHEQKVLADAFNGHLRSEGWELVEDRLIDGRPVYVPELKAHALGRSVSRIKAVAASLNSDRLYDDLRRLERIGDAEPGEAIALAKEIVESCCKLILDDRGVSYTEKAEIPELLKLLREELRIMPNGIDETAHAASDIRDVLQSLGKIAHSLGPIRNAYGTGHGRGRTFRGLQPRHARLAIGAASTFVDFVLDRHLSEQSSRSTDAARSA